MWERFWLRALQPKWEGLYRIPIETSFEKSVPDELVVNLKITKDSYLVNGKPLKDINKFLKQGEEDNSGKIIAISYSDDATIQELLPLIILCRKNQFNRVYLNTQK